MVDLERDDLVVVLPRPFTLRDAIELSGRNFSRIDVAVPPHYRGQPCVWSYETFQVFGAPVLISEILEEARANVKMAALEALAT
jgi:hypothetical protein